MGSDSIIYICPQLVVTNKSTDYFSFLYFIQLAKLSFYGKSIIFWTNATAMFEYRAVSI